MAAGLCALCVGVTLAVMFFAFIYWTRGGGAELVFHRHLMHAWIACVGAAALLGFAIGSEPVPVLLAHFWGTAKPRRIERTLGLWAAVVVIAAITELACH